MNEVKLALCTARKYYRYMESISSGQLPVSCFPNMQLHLSINPKEQQICPLADDHTLPDQYDLPETDISTKYTVKSTQL